MSFFKRRKEIYPQFPIHSKSWNKSLRTIRRRAIVGAASTLSEDSPSQQRRQRWKRHGSVWFKLVLHGFGQPFIFHLGDVKISMQILLCMGMNHQGSTGNDSRGAGDGDEDNGVKELGLRFSIPNSDG
ncbi:hypothetical protein ACH5RR_018661 [Cinchona calisaya]|uniref:Uncharacterized protein n=1 Tax=Cinchona calisaya TaxID=153742 RepID=A0ABD2ZM39_9GENT